MRIFPEFPGNCPRNVSKDAKYRIRTDTSPGGGRGTLVELVFRAAEDERWYPTMRDHPELGRLVNEVKLSLGQPANGAFYINEYSQVIVPTLSSDRYYCAGQYEQRLQFEMEGNILSGDPVDLDGNPLASGDSWDGPHPGIPYTLMAGRDDIRYTTRPRPQVERRVRLSKEIGGDRAEAVARSIRKVKGFLGGRFYVNEFQTIFAPVSEGREWRYVYIGQLDMENWFPAPAV